MTLDRKSREVKLLIGTANFGLNYGITNSFKMLSKPSIRKILEEARYLGIEGFDTAQAYGDAETKLGELVEWRGDEFVSTKFHQVESRRAEDILTQANHSIKSLKTIPQILFFHSTVLLYEFSPNEIARAQELLLSEGLNIRLGASVYQIREAVDINQDYPTLTTFQLPLNITILGSEQEGMLLKAKKDGMNFFARSILIQGLLACPPGDPRLSVLTPQEESLHKKIHILSSENGISPIQISLWYVQKRLGVDGAVVGVENPNQLKEIYGYRENSKNFQLPASFGTNRGMFDLREKRFQK